MKPLSKFIGTKNILLLGIAATVGLALAGIFVFAPEPDKAEAHEASWPVSVLTAKPGKFSPELSLYGRVETPRASTLTAAVTAYIESVPVQEGDLVKQGDLLIQLDQTDGQFLLARRQADLAEAKAHLASLQISARNNEKVLAQRRKLHEITDRKVAKHSRLREQGSISEDTLNAILADSYRQSIELTMQQGNVDDMKNQLARMEAQISRAEALLGEAQVQIARTQVLAPFDGRVTKVSVSPGELVRPGMTLADIYDITHIMVRAQIPGKDLATIKSALGADIHLGSVVSVDNRHYQAALVSLSGEVISGRSSVDGLFKLVDTSVLLELGRTVGLNIELPPVEATVQVPVQSLYGQDRVFIVRDERLVGLTVERVGERLTDDGNYRVLIRSAEIPEGTQVVSTQLSNAITGLKVSAPSSDLAGSP
jgi:multidrug efflux pump subunit AcrA (membrane-fusion protein)